MRTVVDETVISIVIPTQFFHAFFVLLAQEDAAQDAMNAVEIVEIMEIVDIVDFTKDVEIVNVDNFA